MNKLKALSLIVSLTLLTALIPRAGLAASPTAVVSISPASGNQKINENFIVDFRLNTGGQAVGGVEIKVNYSTNLEYVSANAAGSVFNVEVTTPAPAGNNFTFARLRFDTGFNGSDGLLTQVTFKPISNGTATITIDQGASDVVAYTDSSDILNSVTGASFTVSDDGPTETAPPVETPPPDTPPPPVDDPAPIDYDDLPPTESEGDSEEPSSYEPAPDVEVDRSNEHADGHKESDSSEGSSDETSTESDSNNDSSSDDQSLKNSNSTTSEKKSTGVSTTKDARISSSSSSSGSTQSTGGLALLPTPGSASTSETKLETSVKQQPFFGLYSAHSKAVRGTKVTILGNSIDEDLNIADAKLLVDNEPYPISKVTSEVVSSSSSNHKSFELSFKTKPLSTGPHQVVIRAADLNNETFNSPPVTITVISPLRYAVDVLLAPVRYILALF